SICFSNDAATTRLYTLSLHDALPISPPSISTLVTFFLPKSLRTAASDLRLYTSVRADSRSENKRACDGRFPDREICHRTHVCSRSEEHTSELQSPYDLVCRLLLEKKK